MSGIFTLGYDRHTRATIVSSWQGGRDLRERGVIDAVKVDRELFAVLADGTRVNSDYLPMRAFCSLYAMALSERAPRGWRETAEAAAAMA
jgi:hypothetical protein